MTHIAWVPQHHMSLHVLLQPTQICQQQILGAHEVPNFKHNSPELLIVPSHRGPLLQVKQTVLVAQVMVQIVEFSFYCVAKILPRTHTQSCPILVSHRSPPGQRLPSQQRDSHLDNFSRLHHARHFAELLDVKRPVG